MRHEEDITIFACFFGRYFRIGFFEDVEFDYAGNLHRSAQAFRFMQRIYKCSETVELTSWGSMAYRRSIDRIQIVYWI
jgi:hypothetical protein